MGLESNGCVLKDSDNLLIRRLQQGDEQALALLYDRHSKVVYSVALRILREPDRAEDVLQDIFMQIWRKPPTLEVDDSGLSHWLAVVSRNRSISQLRKHRVDSINDLEIASTFNTEKKAEQNLMNIKIRARISELTPKQRIIMELAFFEGMSQLEIATMTRIPLGTIKSRMRSALSALRRVFEGSAKDCLANNDDARIG